MNVFSDDLFYGPVIFIFMPVKKLEWMVKADGPRSITLKGLIHFFGYFQNINDKTHEQTQPDTTVINGGYGTQPEQLCPAI